MQSKASRQALRLALIYIIVAGGWILFSDQFLRMLVHDPDARTWISIYKGWAFVLVTGGLLLLTVRRLLRNWEREAEQRMETMDKLRKSQERYLALFERSLDCVFLSDFNGNFLDANHASLDLLGYQREDIAMLTFASLLTGDQLPLALQITEEIKTTGQQKQSAEFRLRGKDGREVYVEIRASLIFHDGKPFAILGIARDLTQRKRVELALRESQEHFRQLAETITDVFWLTSPDFQQMHFVSPGYARIWGRTVDSLYAHPHQWIEGVLAEDRERVAAVFGSLRAGTPEVNVEYRIARPDGSVRWILDRAFQVRDAAGTVIRLTGTATDITERKLMEEFEAMDREVLQILNELGDLKAAVQRVLAVMKQRTGFDALGFRVQAGDDFPYFVQAGFSDDFLHTENSLIRRSADGGVCRDKDGKPALECACGLVLSGKTDPANPLCTPGGSCWTNDSTTLLHVSPDADPRLNPRNQCIHHGYASVALVPIRSHNRILGLIQFNDRRKGCFTLKTVERLEEIAAHIGLALLRKQAEANLLEKQQLLTETERIGHVGGWEFDIASGQQTWTQAVYDIHEVPYDYQPTVEKGIHFYAPASRPVIERAVQRAIESGETFDVELEIITAKGNLRNVHAIGHADLVRGKVLGFFQDITDSKQAQAALAASEQNYRLLFERMLDGFALHEIICDHAGKPVDYRFLSVNPAFERLTGLRAADVINQTVLAVLPGTEPSWIERYGRVALTGESVQFEQYSSDLQRHFEVAAFCPQPGRFATMFIDITERKQMMAALHESEEKFRELFLSSRDALMTLDPSTANFTSANPATLQIFAVENEAVFRSITPTDVSPEYQPDGRRSADKAGEMVESAMRNGSHFFEWTHRRVNGEDFTAEVRLDRIAHGGTFSLLAAVRDISERKRAEAALRESEKRFRALVKSAPVAMSFVKRDGTVSFLNDRFNELFGYTDGDIPTLAEWWRLAYPDEDDRCRAMDTWKQAVGHATGEVGTDNSREWNITCRDGTQRVVLISSITFGDDTLACFVDLSARKHAETALRESEERFRTLVETAPEAIFIRTGNQFVYLNAAALRLFGASSSAELLGKPVLDRFHANCRNEVLERMRRLEETSEQTTTVDRELLRLDGSRVQVIISAVPFKYEQRDAALVFARDITERKQAEAALRESEEQFRAMFELASIGMAQADPRTGRWLRVNQKMCAITGYSADELLAMHIPDITHSEDRQEDWEAYQEVIRGESPDYRMEKRYVRKDGTVVWVNVNVTIIRDAADQPVRTMAAIEDITVRKLAEEQMNLQLSALTAAANAIVITDLNGKIEWVNPAFTKLTGYSTEEAVGSNPRVLKSGRHSPGFYANLWATIITGNAWHGEMINKHKDGKLYTEEMTITPVRGAGGGFAHFVAIKQDVTERLELALRLQQAQKMEAIGTLAGGIAHDFNNILAAMFGYGYLLKQDTLEYPAKEYVEEILKAANRAKDLVQQILTFSHQREFDRQIIQLHTVVKEAMKFLRASIPANIKIETQFAPGSPAVLADPTQIYQVVMNLATNALHAMEDRPGELTVRIEPFQPDDSFLELHPELKPIPYARLTVADTGHGIDAGTLKRIFEPFFTTKPVGKGTGLGLSVVHGILQAHEGVITVESVVGRGTTFNLYFPGRTNDATVAETGARKAPSGHGQKILLLDDEPALTAVMQTLLARLNYQVTTSNDARHAVALCRENPARFDLVITDLTMPDLNGLEVARQIRAIRPDMPVILTSGFNIELSREDLMAAGICELLTKPIATNQFAEAIQKVLTNNHRRQPPEQQPS